MLCSRTERNYGSKKVSRLLLLDTTLEQLGTYGRAASPVLSPESAIRRTELLSGDTVKLFLNKYIPAVQEHALT